MESGLVELPQQQRLDRVGLGAALRALHHLAYKELYGGGLTRAVVLDSLRILRDHLHDDLFKFAAVAQLRQTLTRHDLGRRVAGCEGKLQHVFGLLAADCLMLDKIKQLRQPSRGNAARADLLPGGVEQPP